MRNDVPLLEPKACSSILDYQLAVTIYPATNEDQITDVFGRVNSGGRHLSPQEQRQAGVTVQFATLVRSLAAELRGDVSQDVLLLSQMPEISVDTGRKPHGYGIRAEDTFWCQQGILSIKQLKESEDEQLIADIAVSVLLEQPLAFSKEKLDELYDQSNQNAVELEKRTIAYGPDQLKREIKSTFSVIRKIVEDTSRERNYLRSTVRPRKGGAYPIKAPLYAIFMAFFELIVKEQKSPAASAEIMRALHDLDQRMIKGTHYETTENRVKNISVVKGLIQSYFTEEVTPAFGHGPTLLLDFENAIRRSRIETPRYEFKQGILRLDESRTRDPDILSRLVETACGIANIGPDSDGNIFLGIADKKTDAERIASLDGISPRIIDGHYLVGIEREASRMGISTENYVQSLVAHFQKSALSEPLKTHLLGGFDTITVHGLTVIRISVPKQRTLSFVEQTAFLRQGSNTIELLGPQIVAASKRFPS